MIVFKLLRKLCEASELVESCFARYATAKTGSVSRRPANSLPSVARLSAFGPAGCFNRSSRSGKSTKTRNGQYRSPYPVDRERRWIGEAWQYAIAEALGMPTETPAWFELPATSQLTLTTLNLMEHYEKTSNPFDFLAVAQLAYPGLVRCCNAPRPSCTLYKDRARWAQQPWRCLTCGASIDPYLADTEQPIFETYRRVVASLAHAVELKRLSADGAEPTPGEMRGLTIPRPVHVTSIEHMGKEVIVDPIDTLEELTAEQLNATYSLIYREAHTLHDGLRGRIRAAGISVVAREAHVSRSVVKAFVNQGTIPQTATIAKLERALTRLKSA